MQLNSYVFILLFLPVTIIIYFIANNINVNIGKVVLLISSLIFYCYSDISIFIVLCTSIIINYLFSLIITKIKKWRKIYLYIPVAINIGLLLYYKYLNFVIVNINNYWSKAIPLKNLILPIGISFFTFQQIAYVVAIYKGELQKNNLLDYLVYILYFPKILMGPLADPIDFINQINDKNLKKVNWDSIANGIKIFSFGLFKKVMIADIFAKSVDWGFKHFEATTSMDWILIMLFYTFEIYFDFSGYSDMAVGSSLMLNITLPINFDSPYKAISIRDFWKRWHISLTKFFTKYIYIPLGGSKKGLFFTYLNTMIVFCVSGIWHGANWTFILWGIFHGLFSILDRIFEKKQEKICEPARWIVSFIVINILWLLFRSESILQWGKILIKIVCFQNLNVSNAIINSFNLPETTFISNTLKIKWMVDNMRGFWMNTYIVLTSGICLGFDNNYRTLNNRTWITLIIAAIAFVWGIICLSGESVFVYFNF